MNVIHELRLIWPLLIAIAASGQTQSAYQISVNVDLVVLNASVRDRQGRFAPNLSESDFQIYEDGVKQNIRLFRHEDVPVTVGLVVDHSGSMRRKLPDVIAAARTFVEASRPDDQMFVVNFNERVTPALATAIHFTSQSDALVRSISSSPTSGQTALYDAVLVAHERLQSGQWDKKALIVISDGGDNASVHNLAEVLLSVARSSVLVYTVGIFDDNDPDKNPGVLKHLALSTGGEALLPNPTNTVEAACARIARDLRQQYTLGYVSNNSSRTGALRAIHVTAHSQGKGRLYVRTRSGYVAEDSSHPLKQEAAK